MIAGFVAIAMGQRSDVPSPSVFMGQRIVITKSEIDLIGAPLGPATICLESTGQRQCYTPAKSDVPFGLDPKVNVVSLGAGKQALLFTAVASAGGSGSSKHLALLQPGKGRYLNNLLPSGLSVSGEQSEYQFWSEPSISPAPLLVIADYVGGEGETHFSSHRFRISTFVLSATMPYYGLRDEYLTSTKYPSLDETDKINVLSHERAEIIARLKRQR